MTLIDYDVVIDPSTFWGYAGQRLTIPTHIAPSGGEATHPSVLYFPHAWNGYHYWMLFTPFPSGNEQHEDPNLIVSNDGTNWIPAPGVEQPLDDKPGGTNYNSDVNLSMKDDTMYAFWREVKTTSGITVETYWERHSDNGVTWTDKEAVFVGVPTPGTARYLSPSFIWEDGAWTMWVVDMGTNPNVVIRMVQDGTSWNGSNVTGLTLPSGRDIWHMEVKRIDGQYVMLIADIPLGSDVATNANLYLAVSPDGSSWTTSNKPLIPNVKAGEHDRLYKSSFWPTMRNGILGLELWYGAILSSSNTWRLYRTWAGPENPMAVKEAQSGFYTFAGLVYGNSGVNGVSVDFTFPKPFRSVPNVQITLDNTVLHGTVIQRSTTGFRVRLENYTPTTAGNIGIQWLATVI